MLRRLWTCSVALLEKGCAARRDRVTPGRRAGGTGPMQGCVNGGVIPHSTALTWEQASSSFMM